MRRLLHVHKRSFRCLFSKRHGSSSTVRSWYEPKSVVNMLSVSERVAKRVAERNSWETYSGPTLRKLCKMMATGFTPHVPSQKELDEVFPVAEIDWDRLRNPPRDRIQSTWIGHATVLVQMAGLNVLTDPVFSPRCSMVRFAGPRRYRDPACTIRELCVADADAGAGVGVGVDVVLVSHNHYDHLDYRSVDELASVAVRTSRPVTFVVPLGLRRWFERWVPDALRNGNEVVELDWHETWCASRGPPHLLLEITAVPAQHWSNRTGLDRDESLWCGFALRGGGGGATKVEDDGTTTTTTSSSLNYLFAGDTGFFDGLYDVGKRYGPFDLAALPIGAYAPRWFMRPMHTNPEDAVRMMDAVRAEKALAVHWGTFPLTIEPVMEPRERLREELDRVGKDPSTFATTLIGETITS